jgi:hypothetical protein
VPRAKLTTFDAAVRHLFRDIDDLEGLRNNPIVSDVLSSWNVEHSARAEQRALPRLRTLVFETAERLLDKKKADTNPKRLRLQRDIIRLHFSEGRSIQQVSEIVGYSLKHCYRERGEIYRWIAREISSPGPSVAVTTTGDDAFYFLLDRALELRSSSPEYAPGSDTPTRSFLAPGNGDEAASVLRFDGTGNLYALFPTCNLCGPKPSIEVFAPDGSTPIRTITKGLENFKGCLSMQVDAAGDIYVANDGSDSTSGSIAVYSAKQSKPRRVITNGITNPAFLALTPESKLRPISQNR